MLVAGGDMRRLKQQTEARVRAAIAARHAAGLAGYFHRLPPGSVANRAFRCRIGSREGSHRDLFMKIALISAPAADFLCARFTLVHKIFTDSALHELQTVLASFLNPISGRRHLVAICSWIDC